MQNIIKHEHIDAYSNLAYNITHILTKLAAKTDNDKYYDLIILATGIYHETFNRIEEYNEIERHDYLFYAILEQSLWQAALDAKVDFNYFANAFQKYSMNLKDYDPADYSDDDFSLFQVGRNFDLFFKGNDIIPVCMKYLQA